MDSNIDGNGLVRRSKRVGEVRERLAVVDNRLAPDLERKDALGLIAVRLLDEGVENGLLLDGGAHLGDGDAWPEREVVNVDGTNLVSKEIVVEGAVALRVVSRLQCHEGPGSGHANSRARS